MAAHRVEQEMVDKLSNRVAREGTSERGRGKERGINILVYHSDSLLNGAIQEECKNCRGGGPRRYK